MSEAPRLTEAGFHILLALAGRDRHGYEILQVVEAERGPDAKLGTTTLYRTLRGLLRDGLVEETEERPADDDQRRRYYRLTPAGRAAAKAEMERLRRLLAAAEASALVRRRRPGLAH